MTNAAGSPSERDATITFCHAAMKLCDDLGAAITTLGKAEVRQDAKAHAAIASLVLQTIAQLKQQFQLLEANARTTGTVD